MLVCYLWAPGPLLSVIPEISLYRFDDLGTKGFSVVGKPGDLLLWATMLSISRGPGVCHPETNPFFMTVIYILTNFTGSQYSIVTIGRQSCVEGLYKLYPQIYSLLGQTLGN